ncbi:RTA1 like protein [Lophiostoma macrostomum CBS 122681]|uniref:RTA1 like protein n=1 Tax=Lophiostoma macrostomum CBS 122681 TaxID=1314788 RepID=A0A6A6TSV3_9PLEO|nr:RTA1 like protein [Lophiostoma macrostomum CBS 122681]
MSNDTDVNSDPHFKYYHYDPSLAGACIFTVLFGISSIWHLFQIVRHRTWYFVPLLVGGVFEVVGYIARAVSHSQAPNPTIAPYIISTLLILVAPALLAASIYMVLGRVIISLDAEAYSLIRTRWLTKVFVTSDVATFLVQLAGGGLMASSHAATAQRGSHIVLAGLILQIVIFAFFVAVAVVLHRRLRAKPTSRCDSPSLPWTKTLYMLYIVSALIMLRSIVRVAEFGEGFEGTIYLHEVYLFVLDGLPMLMVMVVWNVWYPWEFSERVRKEGELEMQLGR